MNDTSAITLTNGATIHTGDAIPLFRVKMLRSAIKLHKNTGMIPTRGVTITRMFAEASKITGKTYKRGQHDAALADLTKWIDAADASMPVIDQRA